MTESVRRFAQHLAPLKIGTHDIPPALRRRAIALSKRIPVVRVAYLFGVSRSAIYDWRDAAKEGRL